ncbi:MAG TPA: S8 family serine peptidase, partial [Solirubrobacteraceae bacterium]|nr:S8 family serine peptidase [Solirubrobacteraceae bacterium]
VKVLDARKQGDTESLARGIRYAVDEGARILNVSINGDGRSESLEAAVRYAGERGAIIVASAGNDARNIELQPSYPASLSDPAILSVAAATEDGRLWEQSNTGGSSVDLAAPGASITSTVSGSGYQSRVGTSAAAPFVSASLALLSAARPDLPMSALRDAIISSTRRSASLASSLATGGRLNVGAAMRRVVAAGRWRSTGAQSGEAILRLRTKPRARAGSRVTLRWSAAAAERVTRWRISLDGHVIATVPARRARVSRRISHSGRHNWRVVGFAADGAKVVAARRTFRLIAGS